MSGKWTPESAEFRTREAQIDEIHDATAKAVCRKRSDYPPEIYRTYLEVQITESEARGAAEQRRKDAELADALEAMIERFGHEVFAMPPQDQELLTRAVNVLAKAKGEGA